LICHAARRTYKALLTGEGRARGAAPYDRGLSLRRRRDAAAAGGRRAAGAVASCNGGSKYDGKEHNAMSRIGLGMKGGKTRLSAC